MEKLLTISRLRDGDSLAVLEDYERERSTTMNHELFFFFLFFPYTP